MSGQIDKRLEELGIELPDAPAAVGFYVPVLQVGNLVVTSGQLPFRDGEIIHAGRLGLDISDEDGIQAARLCAINALAQIKACVGDLDLIQQIVRLEGNVHSAPGYRDQPKVLNGASEFFVDVFGDAGRHTRSALGISDMPLNAAVQLSVWADVKVES